MNLKPWAPVEGAPSPILYKRDKPPDKICGINITRLREAAQHLLHTTSDEKLQDLSNDGEEALTALLCLKDTLPPRAVLRAALGGRAERKIDLVDYGPNQVLKDYLNGKTQPFPFEERKIND